MRLRRLIPRKDYPTWKLIAEICLIIIILITPIEVAHLVFHVEVEERLLSFLEFIDYIAIIVLLADLVHHYLITKRKDRFLKENLLHILSFLPYILFIKVAGIFKIVKLVATGISKIIKVKFHSSALKERANKVIKKDKIE